MNDTTLLPNPYSRTFGLLIKITENGDIKWIRQFDDPAPGRVSNYNLTRSFELANHDIICTGIINIDGNSSVYKTAVYRLTPDGEVLWHSIMQSEIGIFNSPPGTFTFDVQSAIEGLNGDVILAGSSNSNLSSGHIETVVRLNSQGIRVWDANYGNHGLDGSYLFGAEGVSIFMENSQLLLVGLSHGTNNPQTAPAVNFLTLDYKSGDLLEKRFYKTSYPDPGEDFSKSFTFYYNDCIRLANGHFLFYGKLFSDFSGSSNIKHHYGVIEFDKSYNLLKAYTISSSVRTNYYNNLLHFESSGKGLISILEYIGGYEANVYFGAFKYGQFQNQRKTYYSNTGMPGNNGFAFLKDGGYAYVQTHFQDQPVEKSFIEFKKMHNSDTSSVCLGKDTTVFEFLPFNVIRDDSYYFLDANEPNKMKSVQQNIVITDTLTVSSLNPCKQINYCDTVKIHGPSVICGSSPSALFSVFKNKACGAVAQWQIDQNAIDSFKVLNDSSVRVWFKNLNWQGKLYTSLPISTCGIPVQDSISISVIRLQAQINLGPDTVICQNNMMVLNAGNTFQKYTWQDGSTNPTFNVTAPGKYFVTASDLCGNTFSDTINITAAVFPFSIGADTTRCNNDTLKLMATSGFNNYKWFNNYNISSGSGQIVKVYPTVDTSYYATAEKWPGCVVRDTIHISVRKSPSIFLGVDTSLCVGQSLTMDAGNGFVKYLWNDGSTNQELKVNQTGTYFIKATAANSCSSYDTLKIVNVSPLPVFSLGADTVLCSGTVYQYTFNLPNATYLWQDGKSSNHYDITKAGNYILAVTQGGCTGRDTAVIMYKETPSVYLGKDTSICDGVQYVLNASFPGATYTWQDGSIQPTFNVTQAGNYAVTLNMQDCKSSDTVGVKYIALPFFTLGKDTTLCSGQSFVLQPNLNTDVSYLWNDGSSSPDYKVVRPGSYTLKTTNICGSFTDVLVVEAGLCRLIMPNSFTPNRDGLNDVFMVKYPFAVTYFQFSVYNRFGEKVFETADMKKGWDGTFKSEPQAVGTYVWMIKIKDLNGVIETQS
ncbi:MAG: gliding motility-associated C-terminal domain-containing protein, partial [Ginsengibacter sp.]